MGGWGVSPGTQPRYQRQQTNKAGLSGQRTIGKTAIRLRPSLISILDYLPLAMRSIIRGLFALSLLLPGSSLAAESQSEHGPLTATAVPAAEAPSEPWKPPVGTAPKPLFPAPEAELPIPGGYDPNIADAAGDPAMKAILEQSDGPWYSPTAWLGPAPWDSGIELGVNGSSGTSDSFSVRSGAYIKRESRFSRIDFD